MQLHSQNHAVSPSDKISLIVPTYNRAQTLQENIGQFLSMKADETLFVNNCSTDHTSIVVESALVDHPTAKMLTNPVNLGYPRSLFRSVMTAQHEKIAFLSDEDFPSIALFERYRQIASDYPDVGAVVRARVYPKRYMIKSIEHLVDRSTDGYVYIPPGLYAAYMAFVQCSYVGGTMVNRAQIRNISNFAIESSSYPHRLMVVDAAFHGGVAFMTGTDLGLFPKNNASLIGESTTERHGDRCVGEWLHTSNLLGSFYVDGTILPAALAAIRIRLFKFVCEMFCTYLMKIANRGPDNIAAYFENVSITSNLLDQPLAWFYIQDWMKQHVDDSQRAVMVTACEKLRARSLARYNLTDNPILRDHVAFGRGPWLTRSKHGS